MNLAPLIAALRHVGTYAAGIVTGLMLFGVSQADATKLVDAVVNLSKDLADVLTALGVITPILLAWWAARSGTRNSQVAAIGNMNAVDMAKAFANAPDGVKTAAAASVEGVRVLVDPTAAPTAAVMVAQDPGQPNVNIDNGGQPR